MNLRNHHGCPLLILAVALLGCGELRAQAPQKAQQPPRETPAIRVAVNLVNVIASVLDAAGRPLPDLPRGSFVLLEEGRAQKIDVFEAETQQPLDLALMMDTSLSTLVELRFEQEAAAKFLRQIVRPVDRVAVYQFNDTVTQLTEFSSDVTVLQDAVGRMETGAGTALYDAVLLGAQALDRRPPGRRRVIVLVTDAGETTSSATFDEARRAALSCEAMLYTILIRPVKSESGRNTAGEHALVTITDATGGAVYYPETVEQFPEVFDRIDRELRTQYRLGYYPEPRPPARSYRRIELRVKNCAAGTPNVVAAAPGCTIRHRKGYFTGGDEF